MAQPDQPLPDDAPPLQARITYDVEVDGSIETKELPFVVGVLADLSGNSDEPLPPFAKRKFVELNRDNFSAFMQGICPRLALLVDNRFLNDGSKIAIELRFDYMRDFEPEGVVYQVEPLRKLLEARINLAELLEKIGGNVELQERMLEFMKNPELLFKNGIKLLPGKDTETGMSSVPGPRMSAQPDVNKYDLSFLDHVFAEFHIGHDEEHRRQISQQVATLSEEAKGEEITAARDFKVMVSARIAEIDRLLSEQLNEIMHTPEFQRLEGAWRGLHQLVRRSKTGPLLKIRVCNVSKQELFKDLTDARSIDESVFFRNIYEAEFDSFGGTPYGALIGDYEFRNHPQDMSLLKKISRVAAAAHAPFIAAASHELFRWESFAELGRSRELSRNFEAVEYAMWRSFRASDEARYVGLVLPRTLMRLPYGSDTYSVEAFRFIEDVDETDHSKYLWGNTVYSFGACLTAAFAKYRWCAALTGAEGGGLVRGLPMHRFLTDDGQMELKCPTEIAIPDRLEEELSKLGFIPLVHCKDADYAVFFSMQSCHRAENDPDDIPDPDAPLSIQLPYVFATARFVHYLKAIVREKSGGFRNQKDCEDYLNRWIAGYVMLDESGSLQAQTQNLLREARIEVSEIPGKAKTYRAEIFLKPHFQLDERTGQRLNVAELSITRERESGD